MKTIYGIGELRPISKKIVLVIGVFDGLHRGHKKLIEEAICRAKKIRGVVMVMTFWPHPVHVLHPEVYLPFIVSLHHRLKLLNDMSVHSTLVVPFTKRFARYAPEKFLQDYVQKVKPSIVYVGDDFRFGRNREGTLTYFQEAGKKFDFEVCVVNSLKGGDKKISSTYIREHIARGELKNAARLLGRPVSIMGTVVRGDGRGKKLGYATANIIPENELLPPLGVYVVNVLIGKKKYRGVANLGSRPTFRSSRKRLWVEAHIFNFHKEIYGQEIVIEFLHKIREERIFSSAQELCLQVTQDVKQAKKYFQ